MQASYPQPAGRPQRFYLLPIGGTAMAPMAALLAARGHQVLGVDVQLYPPMSELLEALDIPVRLGWDPDQIPEVDQVIIGNAVPRTNPEVKAVLERKLHYTSQAAAVGELLIEDRRSLVVAGTHGKTTTTAMCAWAMEQLGVDPSYLVGGMLPWSSRPNRSGAGEWFVIEGDEYNTAFFDRGPKFAHYRPEVLILGPVEHDHVDIYADLDAVLAAFRAGLAHLPEHGLLIASAASQASRRLAGELDRRSLIVGRDGPVDYHLELLELSAAGCRGRIGCGEGSWTEISTPFAGVHNLENCAMAWVALSEGCGLDGERTAAALGTFPGVDRRLEVVGESAGIVVVDDFAHHPTALAATVAAVRQLWSERRLVMVYEPRSLTAGSDLYQAEYAAALEGVDLAVIAPIHHRGRIAPAEQLDRAAIAEHLAGLGVLSWMPEPDEDLVAGLADRAATGDVVVACSSGSFDGLHQALLARLEEMSR